jgi:YD repeat-containing protein
MLATEGLQNQTSFAYDSGDRLTTITYPDSTTSTCAHDSCGRRTSLTDQNNKTANKKSESCKITGALERRYSFPVP